MDRDECKTATEDDPRKYRTKETYSNTIQSIGNKKTIDFKETKGLKRKCVLNELNYFHILDNLNVDLMHDILEGTLPVLLKEFFSHCISENVFTEFELKNLIDYFDYGKLNTHNNPFNMCLSKSNLGQNASKMKCLFQHLPLILYEYRENSTFKKLWPTIDSKLKILQIVFSSTITKSNLVDLKRLISLHLELIIKIYGIELTPKYHLLTHYPYVIEMVGPVIHLSTLRFETKHRDFTRYAKQSNNFRNLSKSLCNFYQKSITFKKPYENAIDYAVKRPFRIPIYLNNFSFVGFEDIISSASEVTWLKINSHVYRKGVFLKSNRSFYEVKHVLLTCNDDEFVVCIRYEMMRYDKFLHCIELKKCEPIEYHLLRHSEFSYKKSIDKKKINSRIYLLVESIELIN